MGKYQSGVKRPAPLPTGPQPIWRGIGCLLMILVPILSFAAAELTVPFFTDRGWLPRELLIIPQPPDWLFFAPTLVQAFRFLLGRPAILATLLLTLVYILLIGGVLSVFYAFMYRMAAPSRYGPMDAPPPRVKVKKYKR
jgi:hypothetical protein